MSPPLPTHTFLLVVLAIACGSSASNDAAVDVVDDSSAEDATGRAPLPFRIASWNIEQFPKAIDTIEAARELIESQAFDLVGVQEITDVPSFVELADALPDHDFALSFDPRAFLQHAILYRRSRVELTNVERIFVADDGPFPRDPLVADVVVRDDLGEVRFDFTLVVLHLKAGTGRDDRNRRAAATVLLDDWIRRRASGDPDVVVIGDFNDLLRDSPSESVFGPFLIDTDFYRFLTLEAAFADEYSFIPARILLDHVLVTTDVLPEYGAGTTIALPAEDLIDDYVRRLSDHRPLLTELLIP